MVTFTHRIELELTPGVWTDVTADVRTDVPIELDYGIPGTSALDRVAGDGTLKFALDNSEHNSAGLAGYYSPGHANVRAGFKLGIGVRWVFEYGAITRYKFAGWLDTIAPDAGRRGRRLVFCIATDWMAEAARHVVQGLPTQVNKRSHEVFDILVSSVPKQPHAKELNFGMDVFPYALDTTRDEGMRVKSEFQRLALSTLGYIYVKGDATQGGTLVFEDRRKRGQAFTNVTVLDNDMYELAAVRSRDDIINRAKAIVRIRKADDTNTTVLYRLEGAKPQIAPGETIVMSGTYRHPTLEGERVGGTDMQAPVAGTDYRFNTAEDESGTDLTGVLTVAATYSGNAVEYTITNTSGQTGYLTHLQARGRGLYFFRETILEHQDDDSVEAFGANELPFDMWYQSDPKVGRGAARYLVSLYKDEATGIERASFVASASDELMQAALLREISDRVGFREEVTGITDQIAGSSVTRGYFINRVRLRLERKTLLRCTWTVAPADRNTYWQLGVPGRTELGETTVLNYGIFSGHLDSPHDDVAHVDVAHSDSPHQDSPHLDSEHEDVAHQDTAHQDVAHDDVAHVDEAHEDVSHLDVPHSDSTTHSDTNHQDVLHGDHSDHIDHQDGPGHADTPGHGDGPHSDVAHADHSDHADTNHSDRAHTDSPFEDVPHEDAPHQDTQHADGGHADHTDHQDVEHDDVNHGDAEHDDVPHTDVPHQDAEL